MQKHQHSHYYYLLEDLQKDYFEFDSLTFTPPTLPLPLAPQRAAEALTPPLTPQRAAEALTLTLTLTLTAAGRRSSAARQRLAPGHEPARRLEPCPRRAGS